MTGLLDLDVVVLTKIFKFLKPLDFCSLKQSCTQLRGFVDDHFNSIYYVREQWLDLTNENIRNVSRILKNFGKCVRCSKVHEKTRGQNLLLDIIATNCGAMLKGLSLNNLQLYEIDMDKFAGVFDNLEFLELIGCKGDEKSTEQFMLGHEYSNLSTLRINTLFGGTEILKNVFMGPREIKKLSCWWISDDILPSIVLNASELEELDIGTERGINLMSPVQLQKLKRLAISSQSYLVERFIIPFIPLIKELSVSNKLEMFGMADYTITDEFCDALSNLTNLKELRFSYVRNKLNDTKSIEMLGRKMLKLESLMLFNCPGFPHRNFLASACKSDKFRKFYFWTSDGHQINSFIEQTLKDFIEGRGHRCFVSGDPLCIYLDKKMFNGMNELTQDNLQSIERFGNIKILMPSRFDFFNF